jgi:hypothetical protein
MMSQEKEKGLSIEVVVDEFRRPQLLPSKDGGACDVGMSIRSSKVFFFNARSSKVFPFSQKKTTYFLTPVCTVLL